MPDVFTILLSATIFSDPIDSECFRSMYVSLSNALVSISLPPLHHVAVRSIVECVAYWAAINYNSVQTSRMKRGITTGPSAKEPVQDYKHNGWYNRMDGKPTGFSRNVLRPSRCQTIGSSFKTRRNTIIMIGQLFHTTPSLGTYLHVKHLGLM